MGYRVLLKLGQGSWEAGFPNVLMQLHSPDGSGTSQVTGSLPAATGLGLLHERWQTYYLGLQRNLTLRRKPSGAGPGIEIDEEDNITHLSIKEFEQLGNSLKKQLNLWLSVNSFVEIDRHLRMRLNIDDEVRLIVEANDPKVRRLPWHLWNLFDAYPSAEVGLSALDYVPPVTLAKAIRKQIRVLAIFGEADNLNLKQEEQQLNLILDAEVVVVSNPSRVELTDYLWDDQGWDILFFAGHSTTEKNTHNAAHTGVYIDADIDARETGSIEISATESITVAQLKSALDEAIRKGLKLAIFNSCEGLGVARDLSAISIPHTIVMREPIANQVAQAFLRHFLQAFSQGTSLYLAVRQARRRLEGLQSSFPAASWLPVICQNPSVAESLTWASLKASFAEDRKTRRWKQLGKFLAASAIASTLVIGAREAKLLQPIELRAYDHLMRRRPLEEPDERLLLITVTEADVQAQTDKEMSLSNQSLELLLNRLAPSNPRLIGLDIYRTVSAKGQYPDLLDELQNNDRLITTCDVGKGTANNLGIPPSPDITSHIPADQPERRAEQLTNRVGFSDSVTDIDGVTRRQLYGTLPPRESPCQADNSFNILLALGYLAEEGIEPELLEDDSLKIGDVILPNFLANTGSYQGAEMSGYQLMTNYRALESLSDIAETLTLDEVLTGDLLPEDLSDRIVLIGTTAPSYQDRKETPYELDTPGVVIQAHQISQILSAVLENRPLISDWPQWAENVWIFAWAAAGGLSLWIINKQRFAILVWVGGSGIVYAVGYGLMTQAVWIPLIPPMLALLLTCILVSVLLENKEKIKE